MEVILFKYFNNLLIMQNINHFLSFRMLYLGLSQKIRTFVINPAFGQKACAMKD